MSKHNRAILLGITVLACSTGVGCASWSKPAPGEKSWNPTTWFKKEYQEPSSLATIWKADRLAEPGQLEKRGFTGMIYFYNDRSQAIPVDGELVVHGYITTPSSRRNAQQSEQADQKFVFGAEQMSKQYSPSEMGATYSIWVPWDNEEFREEITLIATFKSKKGTVVQSSPTKLTLPGTSRYPEQSEMAETTKIKAKPVGYEKGSIPNYDIKPHVPQLESTRITTIEVPRHSKLSQPMQPVSVSVGGNGQREALDGQGVSVGGLNRLPAQPQYNLQQPLNKTQQQPQFNLQQLPQYNLQQLTPPPSNG